MPTDDSIAIPVQPGAAGQAVDTPANEQTAAQPDPVIAPKPAAAERPSLDSGTLGPPFFHRQGRMPSLPERPRAKDDRKLIVGREIRLSGEISRCEHLIVEGTVEAKLHDSQVIEITESGRFRGTVEIDDAEISGLFEGSLTVRNLLRIRSTGMVSGEIRYNKLEVERGGQLAGDVCMAPPEPEEEVPSDAGTADEVRKGVAEQRPKTRTVTMNVSPRGSGNGTGRGRKPSAVE